MGKDGRLSGRRPPARSAKKSWASPNPPMPSPTSLEEWTELEAYHVCAATIGFSFLLFGYRLYKPSLFLGGFVLGAGITLALVQEISHQLAYGPAVCAGIVGGTLALAVYQLGVFLLGSLWGIIN